VVGVPYGIAGHLRVAGFSAADRLVGRGVFAAAILVDGVQRHRFDRNRDKDGWWIMLLIGVLGVVGGGYALLNPLVSMKAFILLVAFEAIMAGVFLVMLGYKVRAATAREWILYFMGGLSILFGILVIEPGWADIRI
jgi:uncharacterized membrane protein HdeD (DUF308 family)